MQNKGEVPQVVGSVIQRSIIPRNISTMLNIITVPVLEPHGAVSSLKELTTRVFGIATADMIDQQEYKRVLQALRSPEFWRDLESSYYEFYGPPFEMLMHEWYRGFRRASERFLTKEEDKYILADNVILCQLSAPNIPNAFYQFPFPPMPLRYPREMISEFFSRYKIEPEALMIGTRILFTAIFPSEKVASAINSIYQYHIPFGQSPKTTSDTLQNIIKSAKNIVVAPLIAGGLHSATLISTGQYLLAIECAAVASAATIVFVATTSLADYIVDYVSRRRGRFEGQNRNIGGREEEE